MNDRLERPPLPEHPPWPVESPLDGHPLAAQLDVPGRLAWIDAMLARYRLLEEDRRDAIFFADVRARIDRRQRESRLFLGVVGEFSSGKSTLINALIRRRLLRSDILQGTTAAATLIGWGERFDVRIRRRKGNPLVRAAKAVSSGIRTLSKAFRAPTPPPTDGELIDLLRRSTSDESFAKDLLQVDVTLPSVTLTDGLVIVDTPGANASNARHGQVTADALRDVCDAAIVAVPADAAGAESLFRYLQEHAGDVLHRCIFMLTKIDLLRRERDRTLVLENLSARLVAQFGLVNPRVLAAAPQFVVESLPTEEVATIASADEPGVPAVAAFAGPTTAESESEFSAEEIEKWSKHFVGMEARLRELLLEKRLQAQADDVGKLLEQLYRRLKHALEARLEAYRARHAALEGLVIPDIDAFIAAARQFHVERASSTIERLLRPLDHDLDHMGSQLVSRLHSAVHGTRKIAELKDVMKSGVPSILSSGESEVRRYVDRLQKSIGMTVQGELTSFHDQFQGHYRSLATLGGKLSVANKDAKVAMRTVSTSSKGVSARMAADVGAALGAQKVRTIGGGATGAALGTLVFPGVGTVVGTVLGTVFSSMFGPSLSELQARCWGPLQEQVRDSIARARPMIAQSVRDAAGEGLHRLGSSIQEYGPRYSQLVELMRQQDERDKQESLAMQQTVTADLQAIDAQQQLLAALQQSIREM